MNLKYNKKFIYVTIVASSMLIISFFAIMQGMSSTNSVDSMDTLESLDQLDSYLYITGETKVM
jgi:hypothetical protein